MKYQQSLKSSKDNTLPIQKKQIDNSDQLMEFGKKLQNSRFKKSKQVSKQKMKTKTNNDSEDNMKMINSSMIQLQDPKFIQLQIDSFQDNLTKNIRNKLQISGFCQQSRLKSLLLSSTQGYRKYKNEYKNGKEKLSHSNSKQSQQNNNKSHEQTKQTNGKSEQMKKCIKEEYEQKYKQEVNEKNELQNKSSTSLAYSSDSQNKKSQNQQKVLDNKSIGSILTLNNEKKMNDVSLSNKKEQKYISHHESL